MQLQLPMALSAPSKLTISLEYLYRVLLKAWLFAWPLAFPGGIAVFRYWTAGTHLFTRAGAWYRSVCQYLRPPAPPSLYRTYLNQAAEETYWAAAGRARRALDASDANTTPASVPLVRYYVPKLLPLYREVREKVLEATDVHLPPRAFCKWHRMVFRGPMHPTLEQAKKQIKYYSSQDRREILRISRLRSDEEVFSGKATWTSRYARVWKEWLRSKSPDLAIVFE